MNYVKGILSGLAAIFIGKFVFFWPVLRGAKAIGADILPALLMESFGARLFNSCDVRISLHNF